MTRLTPLLLLLALGCSREPEPPEPPPRPLRSWAFAIDGWLPLRTLEAQRSSPDELMRHVRTDNGTIAAHVRIPGDHGRLVCGLRIRLGKGLHKQTMQDYWPAVKRGLEAIGIAAAMGELSYEDERGLTRDDFTTTIELMEVR